MIVKTQLLGVLFFLLLLSTFALSWQQPKPARPLTIEQIEKLLQIKVEDEIIAREITERGLAFRLTDETLERLNKRGAGAQTRQALWRKEEQAAYQAFSNKTQDAAARAALGREFLKRHPQSEYAKEVSAGLARAAHELFKAAFQSFLQNPDAAKLERVLVLGQEVLSQQTDRLADRAVVVEVTTQLALATGRGMLGNFYNNLEQSRAYAEQALRMLENTEPPAGFDAASYAKLRASSLSVLYQCQGLYLLRQANPDPEQAIRFLTQAATLKDGAAANDPVTYWLRALAQEALQQKLREEYQALTPEARAGAAGAALCDRSAKLHTATIADLTRAVSLSNAGNMRRLHEEALAMLKKVERICVSAPPVAAAPPSQRPRTVKPEAGESERPARTIFIRSKTVYLKPNVLEAELLKQPEFQALGLRIIRNEKEADLLVEITLPFLTWNWTYEVTQRQTTALLAAGKLREATVGSAVPKLAAALTEAFKTLRAAHQYRER